MFKGLSDIASLVQQANKLPERMDEMNRRQKAERVVGNAGGGLVTVETDGTGEVLSVRIDKELFDQHDQEMIEDLIPVAINSANLKARERSAEIMREMFGGMNSPVIQAMFSKLDGDGAK